MSDIYRVTVLVPAVFYIKADNIEEARNVMQTVSEQYEQIAYPVASSVNERGGVAEPKIISIEVARHDDTMPSRGPLDARGFRKPPETGGEPPHGPNVA